MFTIYLSYPEGTPDYQKVFRTEGDHRLITAAMISRGDGVGDRLRLATTVTLLEWILLKLKVIR